MLGSAWALLGMVAGSHEGTPRESGGYVTLASTSEIMQHHFCQIPLVTGGSLRCPDSEGRELIPLLGSRVAR